MRRKVPSGVWVHTLILLLVLQGTVALLPPAGGEQAVNPSEEGAPLLFYLKVSPYDRRPYLNFYPPSEDEIQKESTLYFTFNSTQSTYRLPYPRVYMKTLYFRPDPTLKNHLNISYRYNSLSPGTLFASVEVDFEGDGTFDLKYTYGPLNLTPALNWKRAIVNLSGVDGEERWIRWGVVRLNLTARLPPRSVLAVACGEEGQLSYLQLPYRRASPESPENGGGLSNAEIATVVILLSAAGVYVIWDVRFRRR